MKYSTPILLGTVLLASTFGLSSAYAGHGGGASQPTAFAGKSTTSTFSSPTTSFVQPTASFSRPTTTATRPLTSSVEFRAVDPLPGNPGNGHVIMKVTPPAPGIAPSTE